MHTLLIAQKYSGLKIYFSLSFSFHFLLKKGDLNVWSVILKTAQYWDSEGIQFIGTVPYRMRPDVLTEV